MATITKLLVLLASAGQALACVHATGYIETDPNGSIGPNNGNFAQLWDNGDLKCQGTPRIDQDNHYSLPCVAGYVYAYTQNLAHAWYGYGNNAFQWDQTVQSASFDCDACNGKTGHCQQCKTRQWDTYMYC